MDTVSYNVTDLSADQRQAFEGVLGQPLHDDQRVVIKIAEQPKQTVADGKAERRNSAASNRPRELPEWVTIFADLSDEEIADLESVILSRSEGRPSESL